VGRELATALAIFSERDLQGFLRVDDFGYELAALAECHRKIMAVFQKVQGDKKPEDIIQQCMEILRSEEMRSRFDALFRELARSVDLLMPDPCVGPYLDDFKFLGAVRQGAKNLYRDDRLSLDKCSRKIESLIHAHITDTGIEQVLAPLDIASPAFEEQLRSKGSVRAKASHVE
jgi:type I restriction enzyme R subunit